MNTVAPLVGALSAVLWGMANDRIGRIRLLLSITALGLVGTALALSTAGVFWQILPLAAIMSLFGSPVHSLLDATTLRLLRHQSDEYGRYRIWGTYGFIITSSLTGIFLQSMGMGWIFWLYAGSMFLFFLTVQWLPSQPPAQYGVSILKGVNVLVRNPRWLVFVVSLFLTWFAVMGGFIFVGVTMKQMGASAMLVGLASTAAAVSELPVMGKSASHIRRWGSTRLIGFGMLAFAVREGAYAVMQAPWWVVVINLMQAVTYVPLWLGAVAYSRELAPDELRSSSQGILFMVMNLSNVLGALVCGWLFDNVGARLMFAILASMCLAAFIIFVSSQKLLNKNGIA